MKDCLFCKIAGGEIPARKVWEDDHVFVFHDIAPKAPVHALVIPKRHLTSLDAAAEGDGELLGRLMLACRRTAAELGIASAYRVVNNCGEAAGQSVFHIHLHVLGGRAFTWPPG